MGTGGGDPVDTSEAPASAGRKRRVLMIGGVVVVLLAGGGAALTRLPTSTGTAGEADDEVVELATAAVERRTLTEHTELDGTLGYGDVDPVGSVREGTVTDLPRVGSVVRRGETLVEVDGRPVPLLHGDRPMWRPLGPDAEDGDDIEQLEAGLVALGVVTEDELTVDGDWTGVTTAAVRRWQEDLGLDVTGRLDRGDVVFLPEAVRVAEHATPVGAPAGEEVLQVTGTDRAVTVDLEADRRSLVEAGQEVTIELPDGVEVDGTVASVAEVATSPDAGDDEGGPGNGATGDATVEVVIDLDDEDLDDVELLDQAPVTVRVVTSAAEDVLTVPVEALLALAEGGYAVERVVDDDGTGTTDLVPVELGASASGRVEVTGDLSELSEGDEVVVPGD